MDGFAATLRPRATEIGADLVVMGAWGQPRWAATRHLHPGQASSSRAFAVLHTAVDHILNDARRFVLHAACRS